MAKVSPRGGKVASAESEAEAQGCLWILGNARDTQCLGLGGDKDHVIWKGLWCNEGQPKILLYEHEEYPIKCHWIPILERQKFSL